jgi:hypothetical protein
MKDKDETTVERDEQAAEELSTAEQTATAARRQLSSDEAAQYESSDETAQYEPNGPTEPGEGFAPLFEQEGLEEFRSRWAAIQTGFVDDPRKAVEQADELVSSVMKHLTEAFANERSNLEREWSEGEEVSTEDLRIAFRRYRSFFDRLLSA